MVEEQNVSVLSSAKCVSVARYEINNGFVHLMVVEYATKLRMQHINSSPSAQSGRYFGRRHSQCIFLNKNDGVPIQILLKFVPRSSNDKTPALIQIMAGSRIGDKPLSEAMMTRCIDAYIICDTRGRWVFTAINMENGDIENVQDYLLPQFQTTILCTSYALGVLSCFIVASYCSI